MDVREQARPPLIGARARNAETHNLSIMKGRPATEHAGNELEAVDLCHAPSCRPPNEWLIKLEAAIVLATRTNQNGFTALASTSAAPARNAGPYRPVAAFAG